jgi:hypothetical protein
MGEERPTPLSLRRAVPRPVAAGILYGLALLLWIGGSPRWALTVVVIAAAFAVVPLLRRAVAAIWDAWNIDRMAQARRAGEA